jgi:hypothetical protein
VFVVRRFHKDGPEALPMLQAAAAREKEMRLIVVLNKAGAD